MRLTWQIGERFVSTGAQQDFAKSCRGPSNRLCRFGIYFGWINSRSKAPWRSEVAQPNQRLSRCATNYTDAFCLGHLLRGGCGGQVLRRIGAGEERSLAYSMAAWAKLSINRVITIMTAVFILAKTTPRVPGETPSWSRPKVLVSHTIGVAVESYSNDSK